MHAPRPLRASASAPPPPGARRYHPSPPARSSRDRLQPAFVACQRNDRPPTLTSGPDHPGRLEPPRQRVRVDQVQRVPDVDQLEHEAVAEAVGAGERASGAEHPRDLRERPVLEVERRDVVEHREAQHAREAPVRIRQPGRVALGDRDRVSQRRPQAPAIARVELEHVDLAEALRPAPAWWRRTRVRSRARRRPASTPFRPNGISSNSARRAHQPDEHRTLWTLFIARP